MGLVLVALGLGLVGWGLRAATAGPRPVDLVGSLAAFIGVALAVGGGVALVAP